MQSISRAPLGKLRGLLSRSRRGFVACSASSLSQRSALFTRLTRQNSNRIDLIAGLLSNAGARPSACGFWLRCTLVSRVEVKWRGRKERKAGHGFFNRLMENASHSLLVQNRILILSRLSVRILRTVSCPHRGQTLPFPEPIPFGEPSHPTARHLGFWHS